MKKQFLFLILLLVMILSGCSKKQSVVTAIPNQSPFSNVPVIENLQAPKSVIPNDEQMVEMGDIPSPEELIKDCEGVKNIEKADIDLTNMSYTMISAEVFNMVIFPEDYEGKSIKIEGNFCVNVNKYTGEKYFAIIVPDETQCCQSGLDFVWVGNHSYPNDYPEIGQEITVTGYYRSTQNSDGMMFNYLQVTDIKS